MGKHDFDFSDWVISEGADLDLPNPLYVRDGVLPADAREHLLASDDARVMIQYPTEAQRGLEVLEPVFDVVCNISAATYNVDDFSLLPPIPQLEVLEIRGKVHIAARQVWSELRSVDGRWQRGVEDFISAPHMKSQLLIRATQVALNGTPTQPRAAG